MKKQLIFCALIASMSGHASEGLSEKETALLLKVSTELTYLKELVDKARGHQHSGRVIFDYSGLKRDLSEVQDAINRHVEAPRRSPRAMPALDKHYTEFGN